MSYNQAAWQISETSPMQQRISYVCRVGLIVSCAGIAVSALADTAGIHGDGVLTPTNIVYVLAGVIVTLCGAIVAQAKYIAKRHDKALTEIREERNATNRALDILERQLERHGFAAQVEADVAKRIEGKHGKH